MRFAAAAATCRRRGRGTDARCMMGWAALVLLVGGVGAPYQSMEPHADLRRLPSAVRADVRACRPIAGIRPHTVVERANPGDRGECVYVCALHAPGGEQVTSDTIAACRKALGVRGNKHKTQTTRSPAVAAKDNPPYMAAADLGVLETVGLSWVTPHPEARSAQRLVMLVADGEVGHAAFHAGALVLVGLGQLAFLASAEAHHSSMGIVTAAAEAQLEVAIRERCDQARTEGAKGACRTDLQGVVGGGFLRRSGAAWVGAAGVGATVAAPPATTPAAPSPGYQQQLQDCAQLYLDAQEEEEGGAVEEFLVAIRGGVCELYTKANLVEMANSNFERFLLRVWSAIVDRDDGPRSRRGTIVAGGDSYSIVYDGDTRVARATSKAVAGYFFFVAKAGATRAMPAIAGTVSAEPASLNRESVAIATTVIANLIDELLASLAVADSQMAKDQLLQKVLLELHKLWGQPTDVTIAVSDEELLASKQMVDDWFTYDLRVALDISDAAYKKARKRWAQRCRGQASANVQTLCLAFIGMKPGRRGDAETPGRGFYPGKGVQASKNDVDTRLNKHTERITTVSTCDAKQGARLGSSAWYPIEFILGEGEQGPMHLVDHGILIPRENPLAVSFVLDRVPRSVERITADYERFQLEARRMAIDTIHAAGPVNARTGRAYTKVAISNQIGRVAYQILPEEEGGRSDPALQVWVFFGPRHLDDNALSTGIQLADLRLTAAGMLVIAILLLPWQGPRAVHFHPVQMLCLYRLMQRYCTITIMTLD
eukprot:COSAG01_NODE_1198_length_11294_cov_16.374632_4_plen_770_part_00